MHRMAAPWYQLSAAETATRLETDPAAGLSAAAAAARLAQHGPNELTGQGTRSAAAVAASQFTGTMVIVLVAAAAVSLALGDLKDAVAIAAIVVVNAALGFFQEYRAEQAMAALKRLAVPRVRVRRDGRVQEISARELVPGDLMLLEAGNVAAADGRLVEAINLQAQEAALTGESAAVEKEVAPMAAADAAVGDRRNLVFMGTVVSYGHGAALVTGTGMATELGRIASTLQAVTREPTPLQRRLDALGRTLAAAAVFIVGIIFVLGLARGEEARLMFLTAVSMAVAAVPEGLPAVVTIALALGAQRMLRRKALIRQLAAVETLGSVTVICSDKTGTLTENRMRVAVLHAADQHLPLAGGDLPHLHTPATDAELTLALLAAAGALCNDATAEGIGDPTETALVAAAAELGLRKDDLDRRFPRVGEIPFDASRKRMTTIHTLPGAWLPLEQAVHGTWHACGGAGEPLHVAFTKGAADRLLDVCTHEWTGRAARPLDTEAARRLASAHDGLAADGMRVLGVAFRPLGHAPAPDQVEQDLVFVGLVGIVDPPRAEARDAIATCVAAGIRPVMITGDHPLTARYVARLLGMPGADRIVAGTELAKMSPSELERAVAGVSVFARVSPEHKFRLVDALQRGGAVVAMTGDGVNDAPALKKADIGVAMGITGTDVSKASADAVLLDDNFATIVSAVEEGRLIYDNIRKFVRYLLTTNSSELWLMLVAPFLGMPLPLLPLQILWINLVTDGPTALTLGVEPPERGLMRRPPRPPDESIFAGGLGLHVIWVGMLMGALTLGTGYWYWRSGDAAWQTMIFTTLAFTQMAHVLGIRSSRDSLFRIGVLSNLPLAAAVAVTVLLQLALVYAPPLQAIFSTRALAGTDLAISAVVALAIFAAVEGEKQIGEGR